MPLDRPLQRTNKEKEPDYQYNEAKYHPVEEFLVTMTEKLTSDTPSFVLEVTWPRVALFYHPASPLCMQVRDRYVSVAREIRRRSIRAPVEFWAVSCEIHREACEDLGISAVPRLLGFSQGSIEGKLIQRTKNNDIEVEEIIHVLGVTLKQIDEAEQTLKQQQKEEQDITKMKDYQRNQRNYDPNKMHIGESDHMREILHPHSALSDIYSDAMESFLSSIHSNIQMDPHTKTLHWTSDRLQIFREWLDLMHWALPTRDMALLHNVINDMRNNFQTIESSPKELKKILKSHDYYKHKREWSASCSSADPQDQGFGCGFWKLLHIVSVGVKEQHTAVMGDLDRIVVGHTAKVVRDYVHEFGFALNVQAGKEIIDAYEVCQESESCQKEMRFETKGLLPRFRSNIPSSTDPSWQNLAIWVWQAHQSYRSQRLGETKIGFDPLVDAVDAEAVPWPPTTLCPKCYASGAIVDPQDHEAIPFNQDVIHDTVNDIIWNKHYVYEHLKHEYWPRTLQSPRVVVIDRLNHHNGFKELKEQARSSGWTVVAFLLLGIAFCLTIYFSKVRRFISSFSGRHKKVEYYFEDGDEDDDDDDDDVPNMTKWTRKAENSENQNLVRPRRRATGRQSRYTRPMHAFLND